MNHKTAKILRKYAALKGLNEKDLKREWQSLNKFQKDQRRQEYLTSLFKK